MVVETDDDTSLNQATTFLNDGTNLLLQWELMPLQATDSIVSAYIQFIPAAEASTTDLRFLISVEEDVPVKPAAVDPSVLTRETSSTAVLWTPEAWSTTGTLDPAAVTPELAPLLRHAISRNQWSAGTTLSIIVQPSTTTAAERSFITTQTKLIITYQSQSGKLVNYGAS